MAIQREYLSPNEIAEYLGVSPFTIRRYIKLGELKAVKLLGGFRVHRNDLQGFLKAHEVNPAEEELDVEEIVPLDAAALPATVKPSPAVVQSPRPKLGSNDHAVPIPESSPVRRRGRPRKTKSTEENKEQRFKTIEILTPDL